MSVVSLCVLVQLLGPGEQPIEGLEKVDGQTVEQALIPLQPGLHRLTANGRQAHFYVPQTADHLPLSLHVNVEPRPGDYGVALRRHLHSRIDDAVPPLASPQRINFQPLGYELSPNLPETIRVARYEDNNCNSTLLRIDEVPLESYVAGVVNAEIGVFAAAGSGSGVEIPTAQRRDRVFASFQTFAVAARSYVIWWYLRQGETAEFHIKDGPCNQVYKDDRTEIATAAASTTTGQILVAEFDEDLLDKHEYASSCARRGTLPSYKSARSVDPDDILPDHPLDRVCVRDWCGHDNERMAHQDHPLFPAGNRSLVRGICQWGSVERSVRGDSYLQILSHYQPLLVVRSLDPEPVFGGLTGVLTDAETGGILVGADVLLAFDGRELSGRTDREGAYEFTGLEPGMWDVQIRAEGYITQGDRILVEAGSVRYAHFQLQSSSEGDNPRDAGPSVPGSIQTSDTPSAVERDPAIGCGCNSRAALGLMEWCCVFVGFWLFGPLRRRQRRANPSL